MAAKTASPEILALLGPAAGLHPKSLFALLEFDQILRGQLLGVGKRLPAKIPLGTHLEDPLFSQVFIAARDGWEIRLHHFHRSDPDVPHNHKWAWRALILETGYWDRSADGSEQWRAPGAVVDDDGSRFHSVRLENERPAWTLFLHGP